MMMRLLLCSLRILFLTWVSSIEHYWVNLPERRGCALLNSQPDPRKLDLQMLAEGLTQGILRDIEARLQFLKERPEVKPWDVDWFPEK
jgi:hypothetical protein